MTQTCKKKKYYLRVRVTYEDFIKVKARTYVEAATKAEQSVFDRMNDDVEGHTDIEEFNPDDYT